MKKLLPISVSVIANAAKRSEATFTSAKPISAARKDCHVPFHCTRNDGKFERFVLKALLSLLVLFSIKTESTAQSVDSTYIGTADQVHLFGTDSASNWGNLFHAGVFGSDTLAAFIQFGEAWKNDTLATLPDTMHGGTFIFKQPRPAPYSNNSLQVLDGGFKVNGYAGCMFPNFTLHNDQNLDLNSTDFKTKYIFSFDTGHVKLEGRNMVVGNGDPGTMLGYSQTRFVVNGGDTSGGYLYREAIDINAGTVHFPIGTDIGDYTPAAIFNFGTADTFRLRVFDSVYTQATQGVTENNLTVAKTWDVQEQTATGTAARLFLEHKDVSEGGAYNRNNQFVARYIGQLGNTYGGANSQNSYWDLVASGSCNANSTPGAFTSSTPIANSYDAFRMFTHDSDFNIFHYFTKTLCDQPLPVKMLSFDVSWQKQNRHANLEWKTATELNCAGFWVERQLQGETNFNPISWVAGGGNSSTILSYHFNDLYTNTLSTYSGLAHYRLRQVDFDNKTDYSPVRTIATQPEKHTTMNVWPNPSTDEINISSGLDVATPATLCDLSGKQLGEFLLPASSTITIHLHLLPSGIYMLQAGSEVVRLEKL